LEIFTFLSQTHATLHPLIYRHSRRCIILNYFRCNIFMQKITLKLLRSFNYFLIIPLILQPVIPHQLRLNLLNSLPIKLRTRWIRNYPLLFLILLVHFFKVSFQTDPLESGELDVTHDRHLAEHIIHNLPFKRDGLNLLVHLV